MLNDPPIPVCYPSIEVNPGSFFGAGLAIDFTNQATYFQVQNFSDSVTVQVMLNRMSSAIFYLDPLCTQIFDHNDLYITHVDFQQPTMSVAVAEVQLIAGVQAG